MTFLLFALTIAYTVFLLVNSAHPDRQNINQFEYDIDLSESKISLGKSGSKLFAVLMKDNKRALTEEERNDLSSYINPTWRERDEDWHKEHDEIYTDRHIGSI